MKGDAERLRADVDDGYARISLLLLEALACAPLTGTQMNVVMCVIRATYGWAKQQDRMTGKLATLTAEELAAATGVPKRTVSGAIAHLCNVGVLVREQVAAGGPCAYGVNPDIAQWGGPSPEWRQFYVGLQEVREVGLYTRFRVDPLREITYTPTRNCVAPYAEPRTPLREIAHPPTQNCVGVPLTNPCAPGLPCHPTTSRTASLTENDNDSTPPAADVLADDVGDDQLPATEPAPEPTTPQRPRQPRAETPEQQAIHRLWDAFELSGQPTPGKGEKPGYSSVLKLLQEHGIPLFDELAAHVTADPTARLPDGAKAWSWFVRQARTYLAAPWKWSQSADHTRPARPREEFILLSDGSTCPASEWDYTQRWQVGEFKQADNWDAATGRTRRPTPGYTCIDGTFYPPQSSRVNA